MLLDDIGSKLQTAGLGTVGTDIFLGFLPTAPDTCIGILETAGLTPERTMGNAGVPLLERPGFQVICRGARDEYETTRAKANAVFRELGSTSGVETINSVRYLDFYALSSVYNMGGDENERPHLACNYVAVKEMHA